MAQWGEEEEQWDDSPEMQIAARMLGAAQSGDLAAVREALDEGADLETMDTEGNTALHLAVRSGYLDIAKELLDRGLDPNVANDEGDTALMQSTFSPDAPKVVRFLVEHGASLDTVNSIGCHLIHYAAGEENMELLQYLVEEVGVSVRKQNVDKMTPLQCAVFLDRQQAARYLCKHDKSLLEITDGNGDYPLHLATLERNEKMVQVLLESGANVLQKNNRGELAEQIAAKENDSALTELLASYRQKEQTSTASTWWSAADALIQKEDWNGAKNKLKEAEKYFASVGDEQNKYWAFVRQEEVEEKRKSAEAKKSQKTAAQKMLQAGWSMANEGKTEEAKIALQRSARMFSELKDVDAASEAASLLHQLEEKGTVPASRPVFSSSSSSSDNNNGGGGSRYFGENETPTPAKVTAANTTTAIGAFSPTSTTSSAASSPFSVNSSPAIRRPTAADTTIPMSGDHVLDFLSLLQANRFSLSNAILEQASSSQISVSTSLCRVILAEDGGAWPKFVHSVLANAAEAADDCRDLTEDDSLPVLLWSAAIELNQSREFFRKVFSGIALRVLSLQQPLEISPPTPPAQIAKNVALLKEYIIAFHSALIENAREFPRALGCFLYFFRHVSQANFEEGGLVYLHSLLFDLFIASSLTRPDKYGFGNGPPSPASLKTLQLLGECLSYSALLMLGNVDLPPTKLVIHEKMGEFLQDFGSSLLKFMTEASSKKNSTPTPGRGSQPPSESQVGDVELVGSYVGSQLGSIATRMEVLMQGSSAPVRGAFSATGSCSCFVSNGNNSALLKKQQQQEEERKRREAEEIEEEQRQIEAAERKKKQQQHQAVDSDEDDHQQQQQQQQPKKRGGLLGALRDRKQGVGDDEEDADDGTQKKNNNNNNNKQKHHDDDSDGSHDSDSNWDEDEEDEDEIKKMSLQQQQQDKKAKNALNINNNSSSIGDKLGQKAPVSSPGQESTTSEDGGDGMVTRFKIDTSMDDEDDEIEHTHYSPTLIRRQNNRSGLQKPEFQHFGSVVTEESSDDETGEAALARAKQEALIKKQQQQMRQQQAPVLDLSSEEEVDEDEEDTKKGKAEDSEEEEDDDDEEDAEVENEDEAKQRQKLMFSPGEVVVSPSDRKSQVNPPPSINNNNNINKRATTTVPDSSNFAIDNNTTTTTSGDDNGDEDELLLAQIQQNLQKQQEYLAKVAAVMRRGEDIVSVMMKSVVARNR